MKMDKDTALTLNALADDIQAVAQHPDQYELDPETHLALLGAVDNLQHLLAKLTYLSE